MPFKSKAQQKFMFAEKPGVAKEFAAATPDIKALPEKVSQPQSGYRKNKGMRSDFNGPK